MQRKSWPLAKDNRHGCGRNGSLGAGLKFCILWVHILLLAANVGRSLKRELLLFYLLVSNLVLWIVRLILPFPCTGKCQGTSTGSVSWCWYGYPFRWLKGDNNNYGKGSSFKGRRRRYGSATRYVSASVSWYLYSYLCFQWY